jgi:hypothetical protein
MSDRPGAATASHAVLYTGYRLTPAIKLIRTPGHTLEDITVPVGAPLAGVPFDFLGEPHHRPDRP